MIITKSNGCQEITQNHLRFLLSNHIYIRRKKIGKLEPESAGIFQDGHEIAGDVGGDEAIEAS